MKIYNGLSPINTQVPMMLLYSMWSVCGAYMKRM